MEATVNINVKVSLEEATIQRIREILVPRPAGIEARPAQGPRPAVPEKPQAAAEPAPKSAPATSAQQEAQAALQALGYTAAEAAKAIARVSDQAATVDQLIMLALRQMSSL